MGDMPGTVMTLIMGSPYIHWIYKHVTNSGSFVIDTDELVSALEGDREMLRTAEVGIWIRDAVKEGLDGIKWSGVQK
jgi:hypothetical protein